MTRRTLTYTVQPEPPKKIGKITFSGETRDVGKTFVITEMPAQQAEEWAIRAFLALAASGVSVPEDIENAGIAGIAAMGLDALGGIRWQDAKPLLDEMMECVSIIPDPKSPHIVRPLVDSDIEEVGTRLKLRKEIWKLNLGFS